MRATHMQVEWSDGRGESDFHALLGRRVTIHSLQARAEYNGLSGRVYSFDNEKGRAGVHLDSGPGLWVKPCNLSEARTELPLEVSSRGSPHSEQAGELSEPSEDDSRA